MAGKDHNGHGYVLADLSGRYPPTEWARLAITAYRTHRADRIVAEVNNGGDMVGATLRMVDPNVAFTAVRASRGKIVRLPPSGESRRAAQQATACSNRASARLDGVVRGAGEPRLNHGGSRAEMCMHDRDNLSIPLGGDARGKLQGWIRTRPALRTRPPSRHCTTKP